MCSIAEDLGYDTDLCAYVRINLAPAHGYETTASKHFPQLDFVLCCNNGCNCFTKWYETVVRLRNVPIIMLDVPYHNQTGAQGVIMFITQFCDPEETDYPYIKRDLDIAALPLIRLGLDMQMRDFGQVSTSLQAFTAMMEEEKEYEW